MAAPQSSRPRLAVLNVVGLCPRLLGEDMPRLSAFAARRGHLAVPVAPVLPAVTSTMQATYLTGEAPQGHGIVGNLWYDRDYAEHRNWKQSNHLVHGRKLWEKLRDVHGPDYTCAKVFWWNNLYSSADYQITPRPIYCADGRKVFDVQTWPMENREEIKADLGAFPFPSFWGPAAGIASSRWIARAALWHEERFSPDLSLVYLPHLDYDLQRVGPESPHVKADLQAIDEIAGDLIDALEARGVRVVVLSEYGIVPVDRPVHLNRLFRREGWLSWREELGREVIDLGNCRAFALADHQIAHVYVADPAMRPEVAALLRATEGVASVHVGEERAAIGLDHPRSGDLVAISDERSWFTYYYWDDDARAPDFARCVDIHRKPGYDPVELFIDPAIFFPKLKVAGKLAKKALGFRMLMDLIPLDADLVRGSHGCLPADRRDHAILIGGFPDLEGVDSLEATQVHEVLLAAASG